MKEVAGYVSKYRVKKGYKKIHEIFLQIFSLLIFLLCMEDDKRVGLAEKILLSLFTLFFPLYPLWEVAALKNDKEIDNELAQMVDWR